jgi:hypothetical protein
MQLAKTYDRQEKAIRRGKGLFLVLLHLQTKDATTI